MPDILSNISPSGSADVEVEANSVVGAGLAESARLVQEQYSKDNWGDKKEQKATMAAS